MTAGGHRAGCTFVSALLTSNQLAAERAAPTTVPQARLSRTRPEQLRRGGLRASWTSTMNSASHSIRQLFTWSSLFALGCLLGAGTAISAEDAPAPDNGPPRAVSFQVHDPEQAKESRLALVVGNSDYRESPLTNPTNDARAMSAKLRDLGFTVIEKVNATREQ